jgi:3',5'-cyclic AMP phosphodiesterase CpdA
MSVFKIIWADDEWIQPRPSEPGARPAREHACSELESAAALIQERLRALHADVELIRVSSPSDALTEMERGGSHVCLVIADYNFGQHYGAHDVIMPAIRRGIPYAIFSGWLHEFEKDHEVPKASPLCLGAFPKSPKGESELADRVADLFLAPPFRLLHLTDLHYNSRATGKEAEEQEDLFVSLVEALQIEQESRPIDGVLITGDFAGHDPHADLVAVRPHVLAIANATIGTRRLERLFIVPGNHDLAWQSFAEKRIEASPWSAFLDFYYSVYGGRAELLNRMSAWSADRGLMNYRARRDELAWHAQPPRLPFDVVGLVSPIDDGTNQGKGEISREQLQLVTRWWRGKPQFGDVRIALMHHNLFRVLSRSPHDEKEMVLNVEEALLTLMQVRCNLVVGGHTHTPSLFSVNAALAQFDQFVDAGAVTIFSSGTVGGTHGARDRVRSFNVLEFGATDRKTSKRPLSLRTFRYDSVRRMWHPPKDSAVFAERWLMV